MRRVLDQVKYLLGKAGEARHEDLFMHRIEEELQGGEPLLPVDYGSNAQTSYLGLLLLQDYCPEEVRCCLFPAFDPLGDPPDIIPKWCPLAFSGPHIRALEERHQESLRAEENVLRGFNLGQHVAIHSSSSCCYMSSLSTGTDGRRGQRALMLPGFPRHSVQTDRWVHRSEPPVPGVGGELSGFARPSHQVLCAGGDLRSRTAPKTRTSRALLPEAASIGSLTS